MVCRGQLPTAPCSAVHRSSSSPHMASPFSSPAIPDIHDIHDSHDIHDLPASRAHVTSIRALPGRLATMLVVRCVVPHSRTSQDSPLWWNKDLTACPTISLSNTRKGRCSVNWNLCGDQATARNAQSSSPPKTHCRRCTSIKRQLRSHMQALKKCRQRLMRMIGRYHHRVSRARAKQLQSGSNFFEDRNGEEERPCVGTLSPESRDSKFYESEEVSRMDWPKLQGSPPETDQIFVSHSEEDRELVQGLTTLMEAHGLKCKSPEVNWDPGPVISSTESDLMASRRIVLLLSRKYLETEWCTFELQMSVWIMYDSQIALIVPVIVDVPKTEVPPCLRTLSLVDMREPNHQEKLLSILKGPEVMVKELMPFGNVSHGLVWAFYLRYLKIILPGLGQRIDQWCTTREECVDVRMPRKLYILVPASCFCPDKVECVTGRIGFAGCLDPVRRNSAGSMNRSYDLSVWNLKLDNGQTVQMVGEYAATIDTLYQMDSQRNAGLNSQLRTRERDHFVRVLGNLLEADGWGSCTRIVEFQDTVDQAEAIPLSDILMAHVQQDRLPPPDPASCPPPHIPSLQSSGQEGSTATCLSPSSD